MYFDRKITITDLVKNYDQIIQDQENFEILIEQENEQMFEAHKHKRADEVRNELKGNIGDLQCTLIEEEVKIRNLILGMKANDLTDAYIQLGFVFQQMKEIHFNLNDLADFARKKNAPDYGELVGERNRVSELMKSVYSVFDVLKDHSGYQNPNLIKFGDKNQDNPFVAEPNKEAAKLRAV